MDVRKEDGNTRMGRLYMSIPEKIRDFFTLPQTQIYFVLCSLVSKIMATYVLSILITILTDGWQLKLFTAILVTSMQDGATEFLKIIVSFLIDAKTGNFWMLVCSSAIYSMGLGILKYALPKFSSEEVNAPPKTLTFAFYVALLLATAGKSGHELSLEGFSPTRENPLAQDEKEKPTKSSPEAQVITQEMKPRKRDKIVWYVITIVATLFASLGVPYITSTWSQTLALSSITMGLSILPLLLATLFYIPRKPTGSPLTHVFHVMFKTDCPDHDNNNDSSSGTQVQAPVDFTSDPRYTFWIPDPLHYSFHKISPYNISDIILAVAIVPMV